MIILFSNFDPKLHKSDIFGPKFHNFYFWTKLCKKTNSRALTSNMTIAFSNGCPKYGNKKILIRNFSHETLKLEKFKTDNFKYGHSFIKVQPRCIQVIGILVLHVFFFFTLTNFRVLISITTIVFFKIQPKKYPNKLFLVPTFNFSFA